MPEIKEISSAQNPTVKKVLQLQQKSRIRKNSGMFVVEGVREIRLAIAGGYHIQQLFFCEEIISDPKLIQTIHDGELIKVTEKVYQQLAHRQTTEGALAVFKSKDHSLDSIHLSSNPLVLVAEASEKPGNIGALLRTADASGIDAVFIANPKTDLYNPNIVRSSVGCLFTLQIATGSSEEIRSYLENQQIATYSAALLPDSTNYTEVDYTQPSAIVVGTEATGLEKEWLQQSTKNIVIPMKGRIDSLNVSVSAAILIFEAVRQRNS